YLIRDAVLGRNRAFHRQYDPALCDAVRPAAQESAVKAVIRPDSPGTCGTILPPTSREIRNDDDAVARPEPGPSALHHSADPFMDQRHRQLLGEGFFPPPAAKI